ncbi:hypothetical protein AMS68_002679 [Peltaster fructicola]|uniref:Uncharacterized protein n=1 Tax=Peltaster fructicola TaxID=286661 RepID=A0A6H0XQW5_9PEZI|nr:hypothetical protein AMS68_002679 [Peltaster fructicola]
MNGDAAGSALPELTDEGSVEPREHVLEEQGINSRHDPVLFRWISRLSEPRAGYPRAEVDFVQSLRALLEAHGITVVDDTYDYDDTEAWQNDAKVKNQRRVSFDDARYEETWLSNHTHPLDHDIQDTQNLSGVPLHTRDAYRSKHARSLSQDRAAFPARTQSGRAGIAKHEEPIDVAHEEPFNNVYYPSRQELEEQADVFLYTSMRRSVHRCLRIWHATMTAVQHQRQSDEIVAADNDYKMLLTQAFNSFRAVYAERVTSRALRVKEQEDEQRATDFAKHNLTRNLLQHISIVTRETQAIQPLADRHMLAYRFFNHVVKYGLTECLRTRNTWLMLMHYTKGISPERSPHDWLIGFEIIEHNDTATPASLDGF